MIHGQQRYINGGAFQIPKFQEFLFIERFRNSASYLQSWQKDWKILWMQQRNTKPSGGLNLDKLSKQQLSSNHNHPEIYNYQRLYDATYENSILGLQTEETLSSEPFINSISSDVGEFIHYAKTFSIQQQEMGVSRDIDGLKYLMNTAADGNIQPLQLSLPSDPDGEDPLLTFDNPLWRMQHVELGKKLPTTHIGSVGVITSYETGEQNLYSTINVSHVGSTAWVVIHPSCSERLIRKIGECVYLKQDASNQNTFNCYVANRRCSVTLEQLENWAIRYTVIFQEEGDILILFPGVLYGSCNLCFCINSSMKFLTLFNEDVQESALQPAVFKEIRDSIWDWMYVALLSRVDDSLQMDGATMPSLPPQLLTAEMESNMESNNTLTPLDNIPSSCSDSSFTSESILSVLTSVAFPLLGDDAFCNSHSSTATLSSSHNNLDIYTNCLSPASLFEHLFDSDATDSTDAIICENTSITWSGNDTNSQLVIPTTTTSQPNFDCNQNLNLAEGHEFTLKYREICTEMGGLCVERFAPSSIVPSSCCSGESPPPDFLESRNSDLLQQKDNDNCGGITNFSSTTSLELPPTFPTPTDDISYSVAVAAASVLCPTNQFEFNTIEKGALNTLVSNNNNDYVLNNLEMLSENTACSNSSSNDSTMCGDQEEQVKNGVECSQCYRLLSNKSHLKRHMYLKHSPSNISVQCPICLKMFANEISLQRHRGSVSRNPTRKRNLCRGLTERITNDNRLRCSICGQLFVLKSGLNRHLKNIHNKSPYKNGYSL